MSTGSTREVLRPSASVLSTLSGPAPSRGAADEDDGLADRLATARDGAPEASVAAGRSRAAPYRPLSLAYDFHLAAGPDPQGYAKLLADAAIAVQARAPMAPVVKAIGREKV